MLLVPATVAGMVQRSYVDWYGEMAAAYRAGDHAAMAESAEGALGVRPRFPSMLVNLAMARAGLGEHDAALDLLDEVPQMGLSFPFEGVEALAPLAATARFERVLERMRANAAPRGEATVAFPLERPDFFPEGIAVGGEGVAFFVGSVRYGEIMRVDAAGEAAPFARLGWSALGMRVDPGRDLLWVAISGLEQRVDLPPERRGRAGIAALDLDDGAVLGEYLLPAGTERVVGDLVVAADGSVYASDSIAGRVWVLRPGTAQLEALLADGTLASPQGLDVAADGTLYVAAYNGGVYRVDTRSGATHRLTVPDDVSAYGIDGLYLLGRDLLVVQNDVAPHRVMRLRLDAAGTTVSGADVLLAADPRFGEPTLGALAGDALYMVANSPWARFADPDQPPDASTLPPPTVLRVPLSRR